MSIHSKQHNTKFEKGHSLKIAVICQDDQKYI